MAYAETPEWLALQRVREALQAWLDATVRVEAIGVDEEAEQQDDVQMEKGVVVVKGVDEVPRLMGERVSLSMEEDGQQKVSTSGAGLSGER